MMLIRTLAVLLAAILLAAQCQATFVAVVGGCSSGTAGYTVHSSAENDEATQFLVANNIRSAVLPAHVSSGVLAWDSGDAITWQPSSFVVPANGNYQVLLRYNGKWGLASGDVSSFTFLCTSGGGSDTTTTTTTTTSTTTSTTTTPFPSSSVSSDDVPPTAAPTTTTSTTTSTAAPATTTTTTTTTTTPTPPAGPTVPSVMQALKNTIFDAVTTIRVMDFTANVVYLPGTASLVQNLRTLCTENSVIALRFGASGPVSALLTDSTTVSVGFHVPYSLYNVSDIASYALHLVTLDGTATATAVTAQLRIMPVVTTLQQMHSAVTIREEAGGSSDKILTTVRFAGEGTTVPYTTDVSLAFTSALSFTMINNGVVGSACSPSPSPLPYFFTRHDLRFVIPASYVSRVNSGRKSICASYNGRNTVIAALSIQGLGATTTAASFPVSAPIPVTLLGGSTTSLAKGAYTAFVSSSSACSSVTADISLLPFNTFRSAVDTAGTPSALLVTTDEAHIGLHVCMRRALTKTKFAVTYNGAPVTIVRAAPVRTVTTAGLVLTIFNGSSGSVNLTEFIRAPADSTEVEAYAAVRATLAQNYVAVRFVPVKAGAAATAAARAAACQQAKSAEATQGVSNSVMQVSYPLYLRQAYGVLCAAQQYLRVDYVVVQPDHWLVSVAGTTQFTSHTFVLSSGPSQDAAPITVHSGTSSSAATNIAVRFSADGSCAYGHTSPISSYGTQQFITYPTSSLGVYTVCAGIYSLPGTSMFVSTGATVSMAPYELARSNWLLDAGIEGSEWTPCGSVSMCGLHTEQKYIQVCNGAVNTNVWPARLDGAFELPGSLTVRMSGNLYEAAALALMNHVYVAIDAASSQCQEFGVWAISADDGASYGPGAVVLGNHPQVALTPSTEVSGVAVGFVPWDAPCQDRHSGSDVMVARNADGVSVIDMSNFLYTKTEAYYAVCTYNGINWARITDTYIKVISGVVKVYRAEAINTGDTVTNQNRIHLYQTQTAIWSVIGTFRSSADMVFELVWNDETCTASPAYATALTYVSPSTANVTVEASLIAAAPADAANAVLYPCYALGTSSATASPLPFEQHRHRSVVVTQLTLASLYYLPEFALSYAAPEDTRVLFTDPASPPITRVALHKGSSRDDTPQCGAAPDMAAVLTVETDDLGQRWITMPATLTQSLAAGATDEVFVKLCATASSSIDPAFVAVDAFFVLNRVGTSLTDAPMALRLSFLPLNTSTDLLEYAVGKKELVKYASKVLKVPEATVLVASLGNNAFELFIHPTQATGAAPQSTEAPTQQLYSLLKADTDLPLYAYSQENTSAVFALATVEGVLLADQSPIAAYPVRGLKTSGSSTTVNSLSGLSIALFCVVVAPTTVGFVAFSVQQTLPTLTRSKGDKKSQVYPEAGDSPPPRNPGGAGDKEMEESSPKKEEPMSDIPLSVVPRAEDTAANPLYDSDDEPPTRQAKDMGSSPPLRNDTFAMENKKPATRSSASDDDLK
ncbi:hypothetical protein ABB37_02467 [Leptomonas pyrrhocoris]|uniref:Membrane-associated protein n=1 Tax=Leptomonas pyrrhocoris TaxID=157538 RepID=A0A0N0DX66_LEPPY|nr:hypothetical protein ABB37_02467 [Leptomonas pyrrhocoris]KPA82625.1 hypothetical protein ABB37_02467 [Leptomonas pyrrhocoris]|eukprot:XP_015661064.1 hypothetical protein ABB37_02467 [Leptomonas pyrrhocoris]